MAAAARKDFGQIVKIFGKTSSSKFVGGFSETRTQNLLQFQTQPLPILFFFHQDKVLKSTVFQSCFFTLFSQILLRRF